MSIEHPPTTDVLPRRRPRLLLPLLGLLLLATSACNLRSVGANHAGQLGDGTRTASLAPVAAGLTDFRTVSAGSRHSCGISRPGALLCWGSGSAFELGLGDALDRLEPTQVGTATDWVAVSAGVEHTCGIRAGVVQCWGDNAHGEVIPDREDPSIATPTTVYTRIGDPAVTVTAGSDHTCAVHASGLLACWGLNDDGRLGTGDTRDDGTVRLVGEGYRSVSAHRHTCATTTGGVLHCWGRNPGGLLGVGDLDNRPEPTPVIVQPGWAAVDVGTWHTCAVTSDRRAFCWGDGGDGRLGTGNDLDRLVPVAVAPADRWIGLSAGSGHTCGVRTDGRVLCWGNNRQGQLGDGTTTDRLVPTAMAGIADAAGVSAGSGHTHVVLASDE